MLLYSLTSPELTSYLLEQNNCKHRHHCRSSSSWAIALLKRFVYSWELDDPGFTSLDLTTIIFIQSEVVRLAFNLSQSGGPGPCIYVPQWQVGPVIPPGTGFHFRRLQRLVGLRLGCSNPPPRGKICKHVAFHLFWEWKQFCLESLYHFK
jgi:hypothetical protein